MKLRNKKTGEIGNLLPYGCEDGKIWVWIENMSRPEYRYDSLAELSSEWEDYEEPKVAYFIDAQGDICTFSDTMFDDWSREKLIGNYFETEEEAEKAVEKLKAWQRLKDKGFRFENYMRRSDWSGLSKIIESENNIIEITAYLSKDKIEEMEADLRLLFGGK